MIIMISSVTMSTGLLTYGASMFQNVFQRPSITLSGVTIAVNSTDPNDVSWGAIGIINSGDLVAAIDKIELTGTVLPFSNLYAENNQTAVTVENFESKYIISSTDSNGMLKNDLSLSSNSACTGNNVIKIDFDGTGYKPMLCLHQATGPVLLKQGQKAIIYFRAPNGIINKIDGGQFVTLNVFGGMAGGTLRVGITNMN